jgi:hypothetical protein
MARIGKNGDPTKALNNSTYVTTGIYAVLTLLATIAFNFEWRIWGACIAGLLTGVVIGIASDYFTNDLKKPVQYVAKASKSGPAFTILSGISYALLSVLPAMIGIAFASLIAYKLCEPIGEGYAMFGISMSAVGMLSIVGMIISNDAYGPIVDNARGLAEMGNLGDDVLKVTDELDSAGNTVKAITKGFAIAAAGLTVIALLGAFISEVNAAAIELGVEGLKGFDIMNPLVFFGMLVGAAIPLVFSSMLMLGVDRNAQRMVQEIHRQFNEIVGLKEGKEGVVPEYDKCIEIAASGAIKELIPAGLMAIVFTLVVGFIGGVQAIGGFLAGNIVATWESKRSAPIPATSPTLSPTLSAITAGFLGSSSGMPSSTLPTRSALISAVLVKIPPPALANSASELAPKLKPKRAVVLFVANNIAVTPNRLEPTTAIPITAPPRNPAIKDGLIPFTAASAAFVFAIVAIFMPIFPATAEKIVPAIYAIAIVIFFETLPIQTGLGRKIKIRIAATPANRARTRYSLFRNVSAPFLIKFPTSAILLFDDGCFRTHLYNHAAKRKARIDTIMEMIPKIVTFI